jgi:putative ABC transport system permease protein
MRWFDTLRLRLRALVRGDAVDADLRDEIESHLQQLIDENLAAGMSPADARTAARREFGAVPQVMEESRDARGVAWIVHLLQDTRYGVRLMMRSPGFAATAVLTVALGIGATTAMFSIVYGVVLAPLPYREPQRLVNIWSTAHKRGLPRAYVGMANVYDFRARNHVFEEVAALRAVSNFNLTGVGEPERLNASRVSANLFPILGVTPLIGRTFTEDEDEIGHEHVTVLSYGLWQRRFAGDPSIVGRSISLNGEPHTVVGVMRADFAYPTREIQIYTPMTFDPVELVDRANYSYLAVARLRPGVSVEQARVDIGTIAAQLEREYPKTNEGIGAEIVPMLADTVTTVRRPLYLLLAAAAAMLLIGCANLANLLLARSLIRQRELAVRAALGAGRGRLVLQSLGELVPLLAVGGAIGLAAAAWIVNTFVPLLPADLPRAENIALHLPVLAFTAAALLVVAMFVGVWPALEASRRGLAASVADGSRGSTGGRRRGRLRDLLVVAQIATTLWLIVGATLLARSLVELKRVNPGFNAEHVYSVHLAIPRAKYRLDRDVAAFCTRIVERIAALPGVTAVGMVNRLPLAGGAQTGPVEFEGIDQRIANLPNMDWRTVTPDYFRAMQIPLVAGRSFIEADDANALPVLLIDERVAARVFGARNPIGTRARIPIADQPWMTIVGVVGHIRHDRLDEDVRPQIYWSYKQRPQDRMALVAKTEGDPAAIAPALAGAIRSVDPQQPVYDARTLEAVVDRSLGGRWLQAVLLGAFASIALLLASIGVYGVIAYTVGQRRREFGIRLALGASRHEVVALVMWRGTMLFAAGAATGLLAAVATGRLLAALLYNVSSSDLATFGFATLVLLLVALTACGIPARRAASVDPSIALRAE